MTRGVALSLVVMLATSASTLSRAAGTTTTIPGAKLTTITSRGDARSATLVIEATEPVPYVATRPDPLTVVVDFRNVAPGSLAASNARLAGPTLRKVVTPPPASPSDEAPADGEEPRRENITAEQLFANFGKNKTADE